MKSAAGVKDLVLLVADKNMEYAVKGLLERHSSIGIRALTYDVFVHPQHDSGCLREGHSFLRGSSNNFDRALVILDREGCGQEYSSRVELESLVEERLNQSGWNGRSAAIVLDPELEIWVWSDSTQVDKTLGWGNHDRDLRSELRKNDFLSDHALKPHEPKAAMEFALQTADLRRSSSIYYKLAQRVSLNRCVDQSFHKFKATLQAWFPSIPRNQRGA